MRDTKLQHGEMEKRKIDKQKQNEQQQHSLPFWSRSVSLSLGALLSSMRTEDSRHPGADSLIIHPCLVPYLIVSSSVSFFLSVSLFSVYIVPSPLRHLSPPPLLSPCNTTDTLCERWERSQRISIYLTPPCPSSSSRSLIYHTQVLLSVFFWQPALGPWLHSSLSAPLIMTVSLPLLGISQTYLLCTTFFCCLRDTPQAQRPRSS